MSRRRWWWAVASLPLLLGAPVLTGCGGETQPRSTGAAAFVLGPDLPDLPENAAGIRGVIAYAEGFDRYPEYAKVVRCGVGTGTVTWQLQFSASPPGGLGVALEIRDRTAGRTYRVGDAAERRTPMERPEDIASGRATLIGSEAIANLDPDPRLADVIRSEDCIVTITYIP